MSEESRLAEQLWREVEPSWFSAVLTYLQQAALIDDIEWCHDRAISENFTRDLREFFELTPEDLGRMETLDPNLTLPPQWSGPLMNETQAPDCAFELVEEEEADR